jgi:hypothetical protein
MNPYLRAWLDTLAATARRRDELRRIMEPWRNSAHGMVRCAIYCRSFLGSELDAALTEGVAGGWIRREPRRFLERPDFDLWDYAPTQDACYWWVVNV